VRAGAKPVWYVSLVRQVRLQTVVGVGFDAMKSHDQLSPIGRRRSAHHLRSTRVVWHDAAAIQDASDQQPNTFPTTLVPRTESRKDCGTKNVMK